MVTNDAISDGCKIGIVRSSTFCVLSTAEHGGIYKPSNTVFSIPLKVARYKFFFFFLLIKAWNTYYVTIHEYVA